MRQRGQGHNPKSRMQPMIILKVLRKSLSLRLGEINKLFFVVSGVCEKSRIKSALDIVATLDHDAVSIGH
jgi:hypothetical protein